MGTGGCSGYGLLPGCSGQWCLVLSGQLRHSGKSYSNGANSTDILSGKRVNILLLGSDNDAKFQGTVLAQTDIILTIDPQTNYVGMLSIPRDLQVTIPGLNVRDKLDTAFSYGFQSKRTKNPYADAAGLSIATIEENFGIPIDHYAWVGLTGFIKVIDTIGGVDMNALHPMVDDDYPDDATGSKNDYGYRRLYIAAGPQHMDGPQALMYVRTRHSDLVGDFGRSTRQQQILSVLKTKLQGSNTIGRLPQLLNDLDGYVKTDMQLPELVKMVNYAHNVDLNKVDRKVMNQPYSVPIPHSSNFAPVCSLVVPLLTQMFGLTANQARCVPQMANTGNAGNTALASSSAPTSLQTVNVSLPPPPASNALQSLEQMTQVGTMNLSQGNGDVFGFNSIFTVVFMVACESFDVVKV
ncbi:MAG: LytR family transcriptional regulator [Chloroflexi bacterium]|nr:MAG: LytR family transcriptional regulator [Chloroflexota bacterium]